MSHLLLAIKRTLAWKPLALRLLCPFFTFRVCSLWVYPTEMHTLQETDSALSNQSLLSPQGGRARSTTLCLMVIRFKALRLRDHYEWWTIPKPQISCTSFTAFVRRPPLTALEQVDIFRLIHSEKSDFTGCLVQGRKEKAWGLFFVFFSLQLISENTKISQRRGRHCWTRCCRKHRNKNCFRPKMVEKSQRFDEAVRAREKTDYFTFSKKILCSLYLSFLLFLFSLIPCFVCVPFHKLRLPR